MEESERFRLNLLAAMRARALSPAELSRMAGLNARAVKDIEERRAQSPKISTVFALAKALGVDPGELLGLGSPPDLNAALVARLQQYDPDEQERLLQAFETFAAPPKAK